MRSSKPQGGRYAPRSRGLWKGVCICSVWLCLATLQFPHVRRRSACSYLKGAKASFLVRTENVNHPPPSQIIPITTIGSIATGISSRCLATSARSALAGTVQAGTASQSFFGSSGPTKRQLPSRLSLRARGLVGKRRQPSALRDGARAQPAKELDGRPGGNGHEMRAGPRSEVPEDVLGEDVWPLHQGLRRSPWRRDQLGRCRGTKRLRGKS
jgi:hypothetical protein